MLKQVDTIRKYDLSYEIKSAEAGVLVGGEQLHMLLYAYDIVLISPTCEKAQKQLDILSAWCSKWCMKINSKNPKSYMLGIIKYQDKQRS